MKRHDKIIPAVTKESGCSFTIDKETGKKCGAPAHNIIEGKAEIFGKWINLKLKVCDAHMKEVQKNDPRYAIK